MSVTADLPLRHPAIILSLLILLVGYAGIGYEEHLKSLGVLQARGGGITLALSIVGLPVWTWITLNMIGRPDIFLEVRPTIASCETVKRRLRFITVIGYSLQALTLSGLSLFFWRWI